MPRLRRLLVGGDAGLLAAAAAGAAYLAFSVAYLDDYPPIYDDEPWVLSPVVELLRHGRLGMPIFREHYTAALYFTGYTAAPLGVLGIHMWSARLVSTLHGLGILVVAYFLARRLGPPQRAWLAPVLLVFLYPFAYASRYFRPDSIATFYALLGLLLYLHARDRRSAALGLAAGCAIGFSFGVFLLTVWAIALLGVWILLDIRRLPRVTVAAAGGVVVALLPLVVFMLATWHEFKRFSVKFGGASLFASRHLHQGPLGTTADLIRREPQRYEHVLAWSGSHVYALALAALAVGVVAAAIRRRDWHALALALVPPAALAALADDKTVLYLLGPVAILAALVPPALPSVRGALPVAVAALALLVALPCVRAVHRDVAPIQLTYARLSNAIRGAYRFPPRSVVISQPVVYSYWMNDPNVTFYSFHVLTRFKDFRLLDGPAAKRVIAQLAADGHHVYIVYSPTIFFGQLAQFDFGVGRPRLPSLEHFIDTSFRRVGHAQVAGPPFGTVDIDVAVYAPRT